MTYDPRLHSLLAECESDWGDPLKNRKNLIPYGIGPLDKALYGIDPEGELVVVQGEQKNRKTTFVANVIMNICSWDKADDKPTINIDTLESGMRPKKYRDMLISMAASRFLVQQGHRVHQACPACDTAECRELIISPKFLKYNTRTALQRQAIEYALDVMQWWPVLIHGASVVQGNTRSLQEAALGYKKDKARWLSLVEDFGVRIIVVDHIQQYAFTDGTTTDYEKQIRAVAAISDFSSQHGVAFIALSQVSLTSLRESRDNGAKLTAAGGAKAAQEANTVLSTSYKDGSGVMKIKIEESRDAGSFSIWQNMDDTSGCFIGEASTTPLVS
jgi:hypothetical protein